MSNFIISIDPKGILAYSSNIIEKNGRPAAHVIEVLTKQTSSKYLSYLHQKGVSYLFAGNNRLDCAELLSKLKKLFGIEKLMIAGGSVVNWSFLAERLVDELSLVIAPLANGGTDAVSIFEQSESASGNDPAVFHLIEAKHLEVDGL